ncbi:MAG: Fe-S cluster assembly protein SufD [Bacteroidales bacterium]|jgi:Fe-S cluster assembly protein SufD|nr:Fe-S cluster assembly protein SufD [Bacteroidales bacterium]
MDLLSKYIEKYKSLNQYYQKSDTEFFKNIREKSLEKLERFNIPIEKNEKYKYTKIESVLKNEYEFILDEKNVNINLNDYFQCQIKDLDTHVILLSNGIFYKNNKNKLSTPQNVIICSIKEASIKYPEIINKYYNSLSQENDDFFSNLNSLFANDGLFVYVPENVKISKALQIINITHGFENKNLFTRNLFILEENTELSVIFCNHTLNNSNTFIINVTESIVGENASFKCYVIQNEHNQSIVNNFHFIDLAKNSSVNSLELLLHGKILRNNIFVKLHEENSNVNLYGLGLADKEQIFENYTLIDHIAENCKSFELYKNILDDFAVCSFEGKIIVEKNAQKTTAYQSNKNICLTSDAKMRTKPQLEIYADDVKCSHGSTVGQLDTEALFYLQQRGINYKEASQMLMFAFANDVLNYIDVEALKNKISDLINSRLRGELSDKCNCLIGCGK